MNNDISVFEYGKSYISFQEKDIQGNTINSGSFKIPERQQKVIRNGRATIVILDDGSKGVAICGNKDFYDATTGIKIAYTRAKIESMKNELEQLTKLT